MKKKAILRILGIGMFHMFLYGFLVPFVIYPRFGDNGIVFAGIVAGLVSITVVGSLFIQKKR